MSNYKNWVYTHNPFASALKRSYRRTQTIVLDHKAKLSHYANDPNLDRFYQRILPLAETWNTTYLNWLNAVGKRKRRTQEVTDKLHLLSSDLIELWSITVQLEHRKYTPVYQEFFKEGRNPFQKGRMDERIARVGTLSEALKSFPTLVSLQQEVEQFYKDVCEAREEQLRFEAETRTLSAELKRLLDVLAKGLFQNMLGLAELYVDTPDFVTRFFRMELIRRVNRPSALFFEEVLTEEEMEEEALEGFPFEDTPVVIEEEEADDEFIG